MEAKRKAAHVELTLEGLIEKWIKLGVADKRESYVYEARRALRRAFAKHLPLPAAGLTRKSVIAVLDDLTLGGSPIMSRLTARYGERVLRLGSEARGGEGQSVRQRRRPAAVARDRVLTDEEAARASGARPRGQGRSTRFVRLLTLTGQRLSEVAELPWSELQQRSLYVDIAGQAREERSYRYPPAIAGSSGDHRGRASLCRQPARVPRRPRRAQLPGAGAKDRLHRDSGTSAWDASRSAPDGRDELPEARRAARSDGSRREPCWRQSSRHCRRLSAPHLGRREARSADSLGRPPRCDRRGARAGRQRRGAPRRRLTPPRTATHRNAALGLIAGGFCFCATRLTRARHVLSTTDVSSCQVCVA